MKILRRHFSSIPSDVLQISRSIVNLTNFPFSVNFPDTFYKHSCKAIHKDILVIWILKFLTERKLILLLSNIRVYSVLILTGKFTVLTVHSYLYPYVSLAHVCKRVLLAKFRGSRHGSYYRVIETRTNGFRTDSQWRRRPSSSFEDPESTFPSPPLQRNEPR